MVLSWLRGSPACCFLRRLLLTFAHAAGCIWLTMLCFFGSLMCANVDLGHTHRISPSRLHSHRPSHSQALFHPLSYPLTHSHTHSHTHPLTHPHPHKHTHELHRPKLTHYRTHTLQSTGTQPTDMHTHAEQTFRMLDTMNHEEGVFRQQQYSSMKSGSYLGSLQQYSMT